MDSDVDGWEDGAEERLALLEYLTQRGATLEQMMEAHHLGGLPGVAGDLVMRSDAATISVGEVAARCGLTEQKVQRVLLAAGLPMTADSKVPEDLGALMSAFEQGADLMGEEAILAFTRVLGAAATNIAEAAVALFYAELGPGTGREGSDELARARVSEMATLAFAAVPDALSHILLAQFERATHRAVLARGWSPGVGPIDAPDNQRALMPGPSEIVALGFVDLVGSTSWAEGLSLREHSLALSRFESSAWSSAVLAGGRVVKMIGDEVFFAAPTVDAACRIGSEVCRGAALDALLKHLIAREEEDEAGFEVEEQNGVLNVSFEEPPAKFVITPNTPVRQIWISAQATSYKLEWSDAVGAFVLPKTGEALISLTERLLREHLGDPSIKLA